MLKVELPDCGKQNKEKFILASIRKCKQADVTGAFFVQIELFNSLTGFTQQLTLSAEVIWCM
jgi:hypothetical protein